MIIRIFTSSVLAKPLNNAQMCEAFLFLWVYGNKNSVCKNISKPRRSMASGQRWRKGMWLLTSPWMAMPMVSPFTSNRRWLKAGVNWSGTELGLSLCWQICLSAWKIGWQISLSGSVSASLYCTYTMQFMAILGDMGIFSLTKSSERLAYDSNFFEVWNPLQNVSERPK